MPLVIGTAGHIDHGKTSLVRRLTGTDCDRLQEEKSRGITIELGFAHLPLSSGGRLSIVDVPGHEKFVHTMVAGASGIDFVLLVIAADEGVMPQTREHLEICSLLGIGRGAVVITKTDMVDEELLELAREDIAAFLHGTFLESAPVFPLSAHTGQGMDALVAFLEELGTTLAPKRRADLFRLPVDRVFTLKGHGTVVTGTMISGTAAVGDDVTLYPRLLQSRVRSLQSHGSSAQSSPAGQRTAINLQNLAVEDIHRGDVLAHPGTLFPSQRFLLELTCLSSSPRPLKQRTTVHLHHGAKSVQAQLYFPEVDQLGPGETALCEARFTEPMVGVFGDRCVLRSFSPLRTVAGGVLLHPLGLGLRRKSTHFSSQCMALHRLAATLHEAVAPSVNFAAPASTKAGKAEPDAKGPKKQPLPPEQQPDALQAIAALELAREAGATFPELAVLTSAGAKTLEKLLAHLGAKQLTFCVDKEERRYLGEGAVGHLSETCLAAVAAHHKAHPMKQGPSRNEMLSGWGKSLPPKLAHFIMERLVRQGALVLAGDMLHLPGHTVRLASDQGKLRAAILQAHAQGGITPPNMKDVLEALQTDPKEAAAVIKLMQDEGEIVKVADGIWYETKALESLKEKTIRWFDTHQSIDLAGLKEVTGLSRKYLVALLEHFDTIRLTVRVGDARQLRMKT